MTVTPPARARSHSPWRSERTAWCTVTSDEEQAVSVDTAGPSRPSTYDTRPDATLASDPVCAYPEMTSGVTKWFPYPK